MMPLPTPLSDIAMRVGWASMLLLVAPLLLGADDSYLREIEEEAKRQAATLTIHQEPPNRPAATTAANMEAMVDRLASGLDQIGFEQMLRETLPGTYTLYQQLDATRKQKVYTAYQHDNRLAGISEQVIQLLSAKP
ncbi:MAG: hypothetical protein H6974_16430 [Gammaproteobacteria bacterium]|nr:hypothetical protein [Gammaproteobacteria bacterium]MCP5198342.1 hypothetical protein [Gammaproteobacteria bacterium]